MNFLGIGPFELLLILVIATIVLGPERMAQAGRTLGRLYAQYRVRWQKDVDEMTRELRRELEMLQQEVEEIRQTAESEIKGAQTAIQDSVNAMDGEIRDTQAALEKTVKESVRLDTPSDDAQDASSDAETVDSRQIGGPRPVDSADAPEPQKQVQDTEPADSSEDEDDQ